MLPGDRVRNTLLGAMCGGGLLLSCPEHVVFQDEVFHAELAEALAASDRLFTARAASHAGTLL